MERLYDLYFELSNEDRLKILKRLEGGGMNVTGLARGLGLTTQECSRHLSRLSEAMLVDRNPDGLYVLTNYGRSSLRLIPSQLFLSEHKEYFNAHTLRKLPQEFVSRIGELQESDLTENVMQSFSIVESIFKNAEENVSMIHDQYLLSVLPLGVEALKRGVSLNSLEPRTKGPRRDLNPARPGYISEEDEDYLLRSWLDGNIDSRFTEAIDIFLYVSESESLVAFPLADGAFDYVGFHSMDEAPLRYCSDLFNHYFAGGETPSRQNIEEYHERRKAFHREGERVV